MTGLTMMLALGLAGQPAVTAEVVNHKGWSDAVRISNGLVEVVLAPSVGRVVSWSFVGGPNVLWENAPFTGRVRPADFPDWFNVGGDKVWPAEQSHWPEFMGRAWPPDRELDGGVWTATILPGGSVRLVSAVSQAFGIRAGRTFTLQPGRASLLIAQSFEKVSGKAVPLTIWNVSQSDNPDLAWLPLGPQSNLPQRYHDFQQPAHPNKHVYGEADGILEISRMADDRSKYGTDSDRAWVAAMTHGVLTSQHFERRSGTYPDAGCAAEVYTEQDDTGKMTELELLSPLVTLQVGQRMDWPIEWRLAKVPAGLSMDALRAWVVGQMGPLAWPPQRERSDTVKRRGTLY